MRNGKLNKAEKAAAYDELKARVAMLECFIGRRHRAVTFHIKVEDRHGDKWKIRAEVVESKSYDALIDLTMDKTHCGVMDLAELKRQATQYTDVYVQAALEKLAREATDYIHKVWAGEIKVVRG